MSLALVTSTEGTIEDRKQLTPRELWAVEIETAEKSLERFQKRATVANDRFVDERDSINADFRWFNIYYANTNILESALYSDLPKPQVTRRYDDYRDQTARVGALILQRCLEQDINDPEDNFDTVMKQSVQDRLIPGMAAAWLRLETETDPIPTQAGDVLTNNSQSTQPHATSPTGEHDDGFEVPPKEDGLQGQPLMKIKDQRVVVDYVHWRDFLWSPCRTWGERRWVARRVYMTRDQLKKRFGDAKAKLCSMDQATVRSEQALNTEQVTKEVFQKAIVWEIWDRVKRKVHWYAPGFPNELLDTRDDFLKLQSFEPCPQPMLANITTTSTVPRPDYYMIQDQYTELNNVNARISLLIQACKVVGVYDQNGAAVGAMLSGNENTMIPVPNWGQFSEKGGMKGSVDWLPLEMIVAALGRLYEAREAIKGQIYELTGIADIVRGDSKASETLGAQKIKAQFASIRIKKLQSEVASFASEILRIKAEIEAKHFEPATLIRHSGIVYTDNDDFVVDAVALIKSEEGFNWRVQVEADSMRQADYEEEKEDRVKFMSMVTGYMSQALPIAGQIPELKPVILGMLKWGITSFKGAADIEGMIDKQLTALEGKPPPPPQPDPAQQKAQAQIGLLQAKGQQDAQAGQQKMAIEQQKGQTDIAKAQADIQMQREQMQLDREKHQQEMAFEREKMALERERAGIDLQTTIQKGQIDMNTHQQVAAQKVQDAMVQSDINRQKGEQALEQSEASHAQQLQQAKDQP